VKEKTLFASKNDPPPPVSYNVSKKEGSRTERKNDICRASIKNSQEKDSGSSLDSSCKERAREKDRRLHFPAPYNKKRIGTLFNGT